FTLQYYDYFPNLHHPFLLLFFFFYCSRHHRDLHSFPTRRSSDLDREIFPLAGFNPFAIHQRFGLVVLVERGFDLTGYLATHTNPTTLSAPIAFGSNATSLFDIPLSQISDIVGITEITSIETGFPPVISGETISFG